MDRRLDFTISSSLGVIVSVLDEIAGGGGGRSSCGCVKRTELVEIVETGMASTLDTGSASTCTTERQSLRDKRLHWYKHDGSHVRRWRTWGQQHSASDWHLLSPTKASECVKSLVKLRTRQHAHQGAWSLSNQAPSSFLAATSNLFIMQSESYAKDRDGEICGVQHVEPIRIQDPSQTLHLVTPFPPP